MFNINRLMDFAQFASLITLVLWFVLRAEKDWKKWTRNALTQAKKMGKVCLSSAKAAHGKVQAS